KFVETLIEVYDETERFSKQKKLSKLFSLMLFPRKFPKMWEIRNKSCTQFFDGFIQNQKVKNLLLSMWPYYGLPPSQLSAFYYANATGGYLKNGSYNIKPRSQALSNILAKTIEENNGKIFCNTKVTKVLTHEGAVYGVQTEDGETIKARAIVSNASAPALFNQMLPRFSVSNEYLKKINSYRPSVSTFIVWLGLNKELRGQFDWFSTFVSSNLDLEADYQACAEGKIEKMSFGACIYDNLYEGYSSAGTSTISIIAMTEYEPWQKYEEDYFKGDKDAYYLEKKRWADILIQRTEQALIPNLSEMIEVKEAATPLTNKRYTGNTNGAIYGFEQSLDNAYMNRIKNRTPIKGLYLASAWGNPGGGYSAVLASGRNTFGTILKDWGAQVTTER
ncbi:MAG: NAD(P)/FAD-dependent oxidoreductase, partial [Desulfobacteraceae bacterium]|nr:NAD(P)/FAD-dependent oxidoreductase [Desulfobacteraceae bacterium]